MFVVSFRLLRNGCRLDINPGSPLILRLYKTQSSSRSVEKSTWQDTSSASSMLKVWRFLFPQQTLASMRLVLNACPCPWYRSVACVLSGWWGAELREGALFQQLCSVRFGRGGEATSPLGSGQPAVERPVHSSHPCRLCWGPDGLLHKPQRSSPAGVPQPTQKPHPGAVLISQHSDVVGEETHLY